MDRVLYYSDELNDDFAATRIVRRSVKPNYRYFNRGFLGALGKLIIYRVFVTPIGFVYTKFFKRVTYKNKKVMRGYKNRGCFIYGNHTAYALDAYNPTYLAFPRPADIIVNADATSIRGLKRVMRTLGALPIPDDFHVMSKFNSAVSEAIKKKHWVAVYPEAHIWPYYTGIRNFPSVSFNYPAKLGAPVFAYTMTYKKRNRRKRPKRIVYVDGPFFADEALPQKAAVQKLRDEVYNAMCERSRLSDCEYVEYVYKPKEDENQA
ncbi:MAG: 1-acyl-sn-glycerol-3-phosphate acyltransferase [Clostridia bacterium]|nr:1-acyl-sn-glycerol-3-phosphate acyltransferase [Clostridia bacterium]